MMDLNRAHTFVRVVETGGFTRAAEALHLPASSVSRSIARLEEELGVTLLERTTRKVALTDAGRAFYERARDALVGLAEANDLALDAAREPHGVVRVAVPPQLAPVMASSAAAFLERFPEIRLELTFTTRGAELVGDLVDLAMVIGKLPDSSLIGIKLGQATNRLYASPAYLAAHGRPRRVADLAEHDTLLARGNGGEARWELVGPKGVERVDVAARVIADHPQVLFDGALAGLGIALLPTFSGDAAVARGELEAVLPRYAVDTPLHLLVPGGRHLPHRVALFRDHLSALLRVECTKHG